VTRVGDETIRNFDLEPVSDPLIGQVVDSYKIESQVGAGAMGIVYRGTHTVIGKAAAIKVLKADYADDPEMVQRLVREARTVNAIRHPAIVDIFGFGTLPRTGQPYIVMDLLEGQPLDHYILAHGPLSPKVALPLLDELLAALGAAHQVGVIHRDLKPGNVFVEAKQDGKQTVKVIDFGLARQADRAGGSVKPTNPGTILGTPAFMAPEQVLGTKVTPATDLYAVGGIAYQMLTKHLPHEAPTAIEVLSQKMKFDPIRPKQWQPSLSDELDAWVMSLLARDAEDRPATAVEARKRLARLSEGRTLLQAKSVATPRTSSSSGVIPRKEWAEAKTLVTEPSATTTAEDKSPEVSTNEHVSPWAQTGTGHPPQADDETMAPTLSLPPAEPTMANEQAPAAETASAGAPSPPSERATPTVAVEPAVPTLVTEPVVPTQKDVLLAVDPSAEAVTGEVLVPAPRTKLYVALGVALLALIGGLSWLVYQTF
jgi:serine/threonine-protein kinase